MPKKRLGIDVLSAARQRISQLFEEFEKVCVSFSGGKDSSVLTHLVLDEAQRRNRKVGLLFIDLEAQYEMTIEHVEHMFDTYQAHIEPFWVSLPLHLRNAVSQFDPFWMCWDPDKKDVWTRQPSKWSITDHNHFPFFRVGMEFEEFVPAFAKWYAGDDKFVSVVGIRSDESLNRFRTIASTSKETYNGWQWTTRNGADNLYSAYPIYDWKTDDIWRYNGKFKASYNKVYDRMHQAGLTIHQARLCQPCGDDQRKGLWLFHIIEPQTWTKLLNRMSGVNQGALYAQERGNILGVGAVVKPGNHTWESYSRMLLETMPPHTAEHYKNKIAIFLKWYETRGYPDGIPDASPTGNLDKEYPSWQRVCKVLLRGDFWGKGIGFQPTKSAAYKRYLTFMKQKRKEWGTDL